MSTKTSKTQELEARLDRIETALGHRLGLDLSEFDPQDRKQARADALAQAATRISEIITKALTESEFTVEESVDRLETALRAQGIL